MLISAACAIKWQVSILLQFLSFSKILVTVLWAGMGNTKTRLRTFSGWLLARFSAKNSEITILSFSAGMMKARLTSLEVLLRIHRAVIPFLLSLRSACT